MHGGPKKGEGGYISLGGPKALDTRPPPGPHIARGGGGGGVGRGISLSHRYVAGLISAVNYSRFDGAHHITYS